MNTRKVRRTALIGATAIFFFGCTTVPTDIPDDLSAPELFQRAQEAVDENNYAAAEVYYRETLERYGDDAEVATIAEYELGFLSYRQGNLEEARPFFEAVMARYDLPGAAQLPPWPPVLSQQFLDRIDAGEGPGAEPPPEGAAPPAPQPGNAPDLP